MKIIDGAGAVMGRLASYAAQEVLKGEEIIIVNCEKIIISGSKTFIKEDLEAKRTRIGSKQAGPKISRTPEKMIKRAIRGMLPDHREGRGRIAFKKIKCYTGIPAEFKDKKIILAGKEKPVKYHPIGDFVIQR